MVLCFCGGTSSLKVNDIINLEGFDNPIPCTKCFNQCNSLMDAHTKGNSYVQKKNAFRNYSDALSGTIRNSNIKDNTTALK